jgi:hypothetical protein
MVWSARLDGALVRGGLTPPAFNRLKPFWPRHVAVTEAASSRCGPKRRQAAADQSAVEPAHSKGKRRRAAHSKGKRCTPGS